jgi:hypothetical protein
MFQAQTGWKVLQDRYELVKPFQRRSETSETWLALDDQQAPCLARLWSFGTADAPQLQRALWDIELRNLYRVSSSPSAEEMLVVLQDAGVDRNHKCFAMITRASDDSGYHVLNDVLQQRPDYTWLDLSSPETRRELWLGLRKVAQGIQLLHSQNVLHRTVGAASIFLQPDSGARSFRLGGFEWSLRVGDLDHKHPPDDWAVSPDALDAVSPIFRFDNDWFGFGMLAIRCLFNVESYGVLSPRQRHSSILTIVSQAPADKITDLERSILIRLIARNRPDRLSRGEAILKALEEVISALGDLHAARPGNWLTLAYDPRSARFTEAIEEAGFIAEKEKPEVGFNPLRVEHRAALQEYIREDLSRAKLYLVGRDYLIAGLRLVIKIVPFEEFDTKVGQLKSSWDVAFCVDVRDFRRSDAGAALTELPHDAIAVRPRHEVTYGKADRARALSWKRYLPQLEKSTKLRASLAQFYNFLTCTNQMEILMRDAELFHYEVIKRTTIGLVETLEIREAKRPRPVLDVFRLETGLTEYLQRERETGKRNCDLVVLTPPNHDTLKLEVSRRISERECFRIVDIRSTERTVVLSRSQVEDVGFPAPDVGCIRAFSMFGQYPLIKRRKEAILRLSNHAFLLRSLAATEKVFIDTQVQELPRPTELSSAQVDVAKQAIMKDVLRTRPLYALQGPPGTGKTTMVAHLLRQIFLDDPVAQVLVTAQAHGAVDVLRAKVRNEAFAGVSEIDQPLAIRLGQADRARSSSQYPEGSVEDVAMQILQASARRLSESTTLTDLQIEWRDRAESMYSAIRSRSLAEDVAEFCELLRRGASITYCTTSAGDLEELAKNTQSYDWSIIEEAGKCHGFDLALPMQPGHRWLLIGDQDQLPPYRFNDYKRGLQKLDAVVDALKELPDRASGLLDLEWIETWQAMGTQERAAFQKFADRWLKTFQEIFLNCARASGKFGDDGKPILTTDTSVGVAAGRLSRQYRMHPTIGTLISDVYYQGELINQTVRPEDGMPEDWVVLPVLVPDAIAKVAIVWLNIPTVAEDPDTRELGPFQGEPRYTNPYEARVISGFLKNLKLGNTAGPLEVAILSPYTRQVNLLEAHLANQRLPDHLIPKMSLKVQADNSLESLRLAHTVDSFQGNEADLVIVSLVRNNTGEHGSALGFLEEKERMNVLLSRAQRMLVLVGCWDFFFEKSLQYMPTDTTSEQRHIRIALEHLSNLYQSDKAIRLDARQFLWVTT